MSTEDHAGPLRLLLDAHTLQQRTPASANQPGRPELTAAVVGSTVVLPGGTVLWRHVELSSRELVQVGYEGVQLIVHNVEPAGASFLARTVDGDAKVQRGPALTFRVAGGDPHDLFVVFLRDLV